MSTETRVFSAEEMAKWNNLLLSRKRSLFRKAEELERRVVEELLPSQAEELSFAPTHNADVATDNQEIASINVLSERAIRNIQAIEAAEVRLKQGTYGICQQCEGEIANARLELIPETPFCVLCASVIDREQRAAS